MLIIFMKATPNKRGVGYKIQRQYEQTDRLTEKVYKEAEKLQVSMTTTERQLQIRTTLILVIKTVV